VIAHPRFIGDDLNRLLNYREQEGLSTRIVNVNQIYKNYSDGTVDPLAIKAFIADAHAKMGTQYVLLVGGDTYDYKSHLKRNGRNQGEQFARPMLPSLYARTGQTVRHAPVDPLSGDVDDDGVPDLVIGRMPVQTTDDLRTIVEKTLTYVSAHTEQSAVFIADNTDAASQRSFSEVSRAARLELDRWRVNFIDREQVPGRTARNRLLNVIDQGRALTVYFGHSDTMSWGFDGLIRRTDVTTLNNSDMPTAVLQFGCWNTYYVDPRANTLAHHWLVEGSHGAAIMMGATTPTEAGSEQDFSAYIMDGLAAGDSYGTAVLKAKSKLANEYGAHSVKDLLSGFVILGNPALRPEQTNLQ